MSALEVYMRYTNRRLYFTLLTYVLKIEKLKNYAVNFLRFLKQLLLDWLSLTLTTCTV